MSNMRNLGLFIVPFCISLNIAAVNIYTLKKYNVDFDNTTSYISNTINHLASPTISDVKDKTAQTINNATEQKTDKFQEFLNKIVTNDTKGVKVDLYPDISHR
jgi:hypothetical protein